MLSDLARRLHSHQLGALSFRKGVGAWEVEELFDLMRQAPESVTNDRIRNYVTAPGQVRRLLGGDDGDEAAL